ncbi:hypothetical protein E2F47_23525 [Mycobacterium eburneum]|nr:hypothetical protein [Mycobacterium eburneum]TDH48490.1 hypothetical protein E2F47_23525 [Mycobacterium eburneum]
MTATPGILWNSLFQGDEDNIRKILYGSWLWRDWDFANTSLTGFSPFQSDGNLVDTLFDATNPGGQWYDPGYMDEKGPDFNQKITTKPTNVMQSRWAARYDYTKESEEVSATLVESNPIVDALHNNKSLSNLQSVGAVGYATGAPVELDIVWRQSMLIGVDGRSGLNHYVVRIYPKLVVTDYGKTPWNTDAPAALPVKAQAVPDPYSTSPDGIVGSPRWILRDGPAWRAQGNAPFQQTAPVATAVTGLKATIAFPTPVGLNAPTYTVQQQSGGTGSFSNSTTSGTPSVLGVTTTLTVTGLTASTKYVFQVTATDGLTSTTVTSSPSNSITATSS